MTLTEFFSSDYLFNSAPQESRLYIPLIIFFGLLILLSVLAKVIPSSFKKLSNKYFLCFLTVGILGFIYLFGRYEELPGLGTRFFLVLIFAVFAIWIIYNSVWALRFIPKHMKESEIESRYQKYLPKRKSK